MISRRIFAVGVGLLLIAGAPEALASDTSSPVAVIRSFYATLLGVMKEGQKLGFDGRRDRLIPALRQTYDFPLMTRLMVGPSWDQLGHDQQTKIVDAFSAFSIATYANRFDDYSGESFTVDDAPQPIANGDVVVKTQLIKNDGSKVELDYLMHKDGSTSKVIDVYLSGTVSELAVRRSEFSSVMQRGGAAALVDLLRRKTAALSG
jgi:phospholipid transport system substrate-binding protein